MTRSSSHWKLCSYVDTHVILSNKSWTFYFRPLRTIEIPTTLFASSMRTICCFLFWILLSGDFPEPGTTWALFLVSSQSMMGSVYIHYLCYETSLQWRHNERDGVSKHQAHDCLLNRLFRCRSKETSKLRVTVLCEGNSPVTGEFPTQRAVNVEKVSIWWRHHVKRYLICSYAHFSVHRMYIRKPGMNQNHAIGFIYEITSQLWKPEVANLYILHAWMTQCHKFCQSAVSKWTHSYIHTHAKIPHNFPKVWMNINTMYHFVHLKLLPLRYFDMCLFHTHAQQNLWHNTQKFPHSSSSNYLESIALWMDCHTKVTSSW